MKNRRCFIIGLKSTTLNKKERFFLRKYKPWGVILFSRNINTLKQTRTLTDEIRNIFKDKKYPILIDEEGGRVSRLNKIIDTSLFTGKFFGDLYNNDTKKFSTYYRIYIKQVSFLLNQIGCNLNTVPVLDVRNKKGNKIIGDRSYSFEASVVSKIGDICINEFKKNNIATIIKHIPGHGLAKVDSHKFTPVVKEKHTKLSKIDFFTFKNKDSLFAMTAHIIYSDIDKFNTVTHSSKLINLIRKELRFKNLIITDDISMKSLKDTIETNTIKAFKAGCNIVLHCNGKYREMIKVAENSPKVNTFVIKKTSQFYKILS